MLYVCRMISYKILTVNIKEIFIYLRNIDLLCLILTVCIHTSQSFRSQFKIRIMLSKLLQIFLENKFALRVFLN